MQNRGKYDDIYMISYYLMTSYDIDIVIGIGVTIMYNWLVLYLKVMNNFLAMTDVCLGSSWFNIVTNIHLGYW